MLLIVFNQGVDAIAQAEAHLFTLLVPLHPKVHVKGSSPRPRSDPLLKISPMDRSVSNFGYVIQHLYYPTCLDDQQLEQALELLLSDYDGMAGRVTPEVGNCMVRSVAKRFCAS